MTRPSHNPSTMQLQTWACFLNHNLIEDTLPSSFQLLQHTLALRKVVAAVLWPQQCSSISSNFGPWWIQLYCVGEAIKVITSLSLIERPASWALDAIICYLLLRGSSRTTIPSRPKKNNPAINLEMAWT